MRTFRLVLKSGFDLNFKNTFYISFFSKNFVSIAKLVPFGFKSVFKNSIFSLFKNGTIVGNGSLVDGLYKFNLNPTYEYNLITMHDNNVGTKHCIINEHSSKPWHRRSGHISIEQIKRLVNDGVL